MNFLLSYFSVDSANISLFFCAAFCFFINLLNVPFLCSSGCAAFAAAKSVPWCLSKLPGFHGIVKA
jgi:hypothetical protein